MAVYFANYPKLQHVWRQGGFGKITAWGGSSNAKVPLWRDLEAIPRPSPDSSHASVFRKLQAS
jgi:hypothetical protein